MEHIHGSDFITEPGLTIPVVEKTLRERLSSDFDSEDNPADADSEATVFAKHIGGEHGANTFVIKTRFKGARVGFPSKPVDWGTYQFVWKIPYNDMPFEIKNFADVNMPQWNRVVRVFKRARRGLEMDGQNLASLNNYFKYTGWGFPIVVHPNYSRVSCGSGYP
ncbi:MAG: hypothetical protein QXW45_00845 [Thermosphaera sp.]